MSAWNALLTSPICEFLFIFQDPVEISPQMRSLLSSIVPALITWHRNVHTKPCSPSGAVVSEVRDHACCPQGSACAGQAPGLWPTLSQCWSHRSAPGHASRGWKAAQPPGPFHLLLGPSPSLTPAHQAQGGRGFREGLPGQSRPRLALGLRVPAAATCQGRAKEQCPDTVFSIPRT